MKLIDPEETFGQTGWLAVKGPPNALKDNAAGGIVGRTVHEGKTYSLLETMGLGVTDLLQSGRRIGKAELIVLDLWQSHRMFASLLLSGPRWYAQPGQKDVTWHNLYVLWQGRRSNASNNSLLNNIDLDPAWSAVMSRSSQGIMIGQAYVAGKLLTHLTIVDYRIRGEDGPNRVTFKIENLTFEGDEPPRWIHPSIMAHTKQTIELFQQHCAASDMGEKPPYWETLLSDALAEWQLKADTYKTWYDASSEIKTPWDFMVYCKFWAALARAAKGSPEKLHTRMLRQLGKHVSAERLAELTRLWQSAQQMKLL